MIVFDLDGTLANCEHRVHHITGLSDKSSDERYRAFFADCTKDEVIASGYVAWMAFVESHDLAIVTGRSDEVREETIAWLVKNEFFYDYDAADSALFMRSAGDKRHDTTIKLDLLSEACAHFGGDPIIIFEDRDSVVKMWRKNGYTCFQVADGDF